MKLLAQRCPWLASVPPMGHTWHKQNVYDTSDPKVAHWWQNVVGVTSGNLTSCWLHVKPMNKITLAQQQLLNRPNIGQISLCYLGVPYVLLYKSNGTLNA